MIHPLIKKLAVETDRSHDQLWNHKISGDTLELYTLPCYEQEPESYRLGVIQTGRVLQALELQIVRKGGVIQVHSFPNLNESRLTAVVRFHRRANGVHRDRKSAEPSPPDSNHPEKRFSSIATAYGLSLHPLRHERDDRIRQIVGRSGMKSDQQRQLYLLCSRIDNPFIWLKTGRWIERVLDLVELNRGSQSTVQLNSAERAGLATDTDSCDYVQLLFQSG